MKRTGRITFLLLLAAVAAGCTNKQGETESPVYLARRGKRDRMGDVLSWVFGHYRLILRGEAEGRETPVSVKVA